MSNQTSPRRAAPEPARRKQPFEQESYTGHLFIRDDKESSKHPDCDGTIKIGQRTFEIAGWFRKSESSGKDYIFLKIGSERF